jgi:hypothetical protein
MSLLTKQEILSALQRLGQLAHEKREQIRLLILGGAVMVLVYETRPATRDVDAVILSPEPRTVRELAKRVADEANLPPEWLNDGAKGYLVGSSELTEIYSAKGIVISRPSLTHLLAMKLSAWRDDIDIADARRLLADIAGDRDSIWSLVEPHLVPGQELKAKYAFLDLWETVYGHH